MARARNLKPSFFTDDEIAELAPLTRLLFCGLWCVADREGRLEDKPKKIKAELLPYDVGNVERMLQDLHGAKFIVRYEHDGKRYIQIRSFAKHQNPHVKEAPSTIPAPCSAPVEHRIDSGNSGTSRADSLLLIPDSLNPLPDSLNPPPDSGLPQPARPPVATRPATAVEANGNVKSRRVLEGENPKAEDPWPRRIPEVSDPQGLDECAKAYGIDVRSRHFGSYAELQTACFTARNQLREQHERATGATHEHRH